MKYLALIVVVCSIVGCSSDRQVLRLEDINDAAHFRDAMGRPSGITRQVQDSKTSVHSNVDQVVVRKFSDGGSARIQYYHNRPAGIWLIETCEAEIELRFENGELNSVQVSPRETLLKKSSNTPPELPIKPMSRNLFERNGA